MQWLSCEEVEINGTVQQPTSSSALVKRLDKQHCPCWQDRTNLFAQCATMIQQAHVLTIKLSKRRISAEFWYQHAHHVSADT